MNSNDGLGLPKITLNQLLELLILISEKINKEQKQGIFIWGSPGIGKSDLVKTLAEKTGRNLVDIRLSTIDPVDLRGLPVINGESTLTKWLPPDFLPKRNASPGILFLDEVNVAPPSVQAAAYQLILDRKLGDYEVPKNWIVLAAGNRVGDRSVTFKLPTALSNRFTHFEIDPNIDDWVSWAWKNSIDPYIISFLRYQPHLLNQFDPNSSSIAFATPRSWAFASTFSDIRSINPLLYLKSIQGTLGEAVATQFIAFMKYQADLPDPEHILLGKEFEFPNRPDTQFLLLPSLISKLLEAPNPERMSNFFKYVNYYSNSHHPDYAIILVRELLMASKSKNNTSHSSDLFLTISSDRNFKEWAHKNIEVMQ